MSALTVAFATACAAFLSACIGALVSYKVNERKIRAQIISASRQKWIDVMQDLLAELMSLLYSVAIIKRQINSADPVATLAADRPLLEKLEHVALVKSKIRLMVNPAKPNHHALYEAVETAYERLVSRDQFDVIDELRVDIDHIAHKAREIFKVEWERVKSGE